jgi:hypothetical protein
MKMNHSTKIASFLVLSASTMLALPGCMADVAEQEDETQESTELSLAATADEANTDNQGGETTAEDSEALNLAHPFGLYPPGYGFGGWYPGYGRFRPGFGYFHPGFGYLPPGYGYLPPGFGYWRPGFGYWRPRFGYWRPGFGWGGW